MLPETVGFLIPVSVRLAAVVAAMMSVPVSLVTVTTCPATATASTPAMAVWADTVAPTPLTSKPLGKVTLIFPSVGTAPTVVKSTTTLPVAPATSDAGSTFVADSAAAYTLGTTISSTAASASAATNGVLFKADANMSSSFSVANALSAPWVVQETLN